MLTCDRIGVVYLRAINFLKGFHRANRANQLKIGVIIEQVTREERNQLAVEQGKFVEEHFIKPYQPILAQWSANSAV